MHYVFSYGMKQIDNLSGQKVSVFFVIRVFQIFFIMLQVDRAPDWVLAVTGVINIDNSINSLPKGIIFYLYSLPGGNPTNEISSTFMKN